MRKDAPIISCFHLTLAAPGGGDSPQLIDDVSLELEQGSWNEIVGPSGAGKSLLFGILSLRFVPDDGRLVVDGRNFHRLSGRGVADLRRRFASCAETPVLLEDRTVIENLVLPFVVRREEGRALSVCEELLEDAGLGRLRDVPVCDLARQERALVGLLRAVSGDSRLILIDGVLEQLEDEHLRTAMRLLQRRHLDGATVVVFGREPTQNARRGRIFRMQDGAIEAVDESHPHAPVPETTGRRV
jgi:ABC-type lipoprotein export system ATPase subunit